MRTPLPAHCWLLILMMSALAGCAPDRSMVEESQLDESPGDVRPRAAATRPAVLGDFDAELRTPDGRFDTPAMIDALTRMGVNTYVYQIWHAPTDWDDLPAFAEAARRANIDVWVWLMPWSMTPANGKKRYSEPYRLDFVRWAEEVARLSLKSPNVVGYVIDDFYVNAQPDRFSPRYVRQFVDAGRRVNPKIKFYPQLYFQQPWGPFVERFGPLVDGVIVAYPRSASEIHHALRYLNGRAYGPSFSVSFQRREGVDEGEFAVIEANLPVTDPAAATLTFYWNHTARNDQAGAREAFVRVNGRVAWTADCSARDPDKVVRLKLEREAQGRRTIRIEMGVAVRRKNRFPLEARMDDIRLTGVALPASPAEDVWRLRQPNHGDRRVAGEEDDSADLTPGGPASDLHCPLLVMVAAEPAQHEMRYSQPGDARNVGRVMNVSADLQVRGLIEGTVTYCTPKGADDPIFRTVRQTYERARAKRDGTQP